MILDQIIALRVLYLLVTPFKKQEAYKLKVIDEDGNPLLKIADMTKEQKNSYTMLHRLCFRLKKVLGVLPFGKTTLASMAAAYVLVKECMENESEPDNLEQLFEMKLDAMPVCESVDQIYISEVESIMNNLQKFIQILEDGVPTGTTAGISAAATNTPVIKNKKPKITYVTRGAFSKMKNDRNMLPEGVNIVICDETGETIVISDEVL